MFHVGQKVVCVDDSDFCHHHCPNKPKRGSVYTIRGFSDDIPKHVTAIWLEEIANPVVRWPHGWVGEVSFRASRFRPVIERKTDISIFTRMLNTNTEKVG